MMEQPGHFVFITKRLGERAADREARRKASGLPPEPSFGETVRQKVKTLAEMMRRYRPSRT
ncbi:MAG TPA: hypothetical protein VN711_01525 [Candidatus Saccharimonadales bacterium]|nr:hypothetical protein [Candidatus Saccharimonadales bacterium]